MADNSETFELNITATDDAARPALERTNSTLENIEKTLGRLSHLAVSVFESIARIALKAAEAVAGLGVAYESFRLVHSRITSGVVSGNAMQAASFESMINSLRRWRLEWAAVQSIRAASFAPLAGASITVGAGIIGEEAFRITNNRGRFLEQQAILAAKTKEIGLRSMQALTIAGSQRGVSGSTLGRGFDYMMANSQRFLSSSGISTDQSAPEILGQTFRLLGQINDPVERARQTFRVFGQELGEQLLPLIGNAFLDNARKAQRWGAVLDEISAGSIQRFRRDLLDLKETFTSVASAISIGETALENKIASLTANTYAAGRGMAVGSIISPMTAARAGRSSLSQYPVSTALAFMTPALWQALLTGTAIGITSPTPKPTAEEKLDFIRPYMRDWLDKWGFSGEEMAHVPPGQGLRALMSGDLQAYANTQIGRFQQSSSFVQDRFSETLATRNNLLRQLMYGIEEPQYEINKDGRRVPKLNAAGAPEVIERPLSPEERAWRIAALPDIVRMLASDQSTLLGRQDAGAQLERILSSRQRLEDVIASPSPIARAYLQAFRSQRPQEVHQDQITGAYSIRSLPVSAEEQKNIVDSLQTELTRIVKDWAGQYLNDLHEQGMKALAFQGQRMVQSNAYLSETGRMAAGVLEQQLDIEPGAQITRDARLRALEIANPRTFEGRMAAIQSRQQIEQDYLKASFGYQGERLGRQQEGDVMELQAEMARYKPGSPEAKAVQDRINWTIQGYGVQGDRLNQQYSSQMQAAQDEASARSAQLLDERYQSTFDRLRSTISSVFDDMTRRGQNFGQAVGNAIKQGVLSALNSIVSGSIASLLMNAMGIQGSSGVNARGRSVFTPGGSGFSGIWGGISSLFTRHRTDTAPVSGNVSGDMSGLVMGGLPSFFSAVSAPSVMPVGVGVGLGGPFDSNPASMIGPGGTAGFSGPVPMSSNGNLLQRIFGSKQGSGVLGVVGLSSQSLAAMRQLHGGSGGFWNQAGTVADSIATSPAAQAASGMVLYSGIAKKNTFETLAGGAALGYSAGSNYLGYAGGPIAGLGGSMMVNGWQRGGTGGLFEDMAGGAMAGGSIGMREAGPMGAVVGAAVGAFVGMAEGTIRLFVQSSAEQMSSKIKNYYGVTIPTSGSGMTVLKQIMDIANKQYHGHYDSALTDPQVRQLVMLYGQTTSQNVPMNIIPRAYGMVEENGGLFQTPTYLNGQTIGYNGGLPSLGSSSRYVNSANQPVSSQASQVNLQLDGEATTNLLSGVATGVIRSKPTLVQSSVQDAMNSNSGRLGMMTTGLEPMTILG